MKSKLSFLPISLLAALLHTAQAEIPNSIAHQGRVAVGNTNFHGTGNFKFLIFEDDDDNHNNGGESALWANNLNDGVPFAEPTGSVPIEVRRGLYATSLGAPPMEPFGGSLEPAPGKKLFLAIWFSGGGGTFHKLNPDIEFGAVPFALNALHVADRSITQASIADGAVVSRTLAPGAITADAIAPGAITATSIAPGAITADAISPGAVSQLGTPDGTTPDALHITAQGHVGISTPDPEATLHIGGGLIVDNDSGLIELNANQVQLGSGTATTGDSTLATGKSTTATGHYSTAMGRNTTATGDYAFSNGRGTIAHSAYETVIGRFNENYAAHDTAEWNPFDRVFVIGNGTALNERSNLLTVYKYGFFKFDGLGEFKNGLTSGTDITTSGDYLYDTPKTGHVQVPGTAFALASNHPDERYFRSPDGAIGLNAGNQSLQLYAPVLLPDGATVTTFEIAYRDFSDTFNITNLSGSLYRVGFTSNDTQSLAGIGGLFTGGSSESVRTATDSSISHPLIDNQTYTYLLSVSLEGDGGSSGLTFKAARITYTTSKVSN